MAKSDLTYLMYGGLFGEVIGKRAGGHYMHQPADLLNDQIAGARAEVFQNSSAKAAHTNALTIVSSLEALEEPACLVGHSKGGLEILLAAFIAPEVLLAMKYRFSFL